MNVHGSLATVGDVADQVRGVSYDKSDASSAAGPGLVPLLRANNIADDRLTYDGLIYVPSKCVSEKQHLRKNDVVIAASSGSLTSVGKAGAVEDEHFPGTFGAFCKVLRPNQQKVDPRYFAHFFRTADYRRTISALAAGANINNLKNEHLSDLVIPLPPLDEQRRIAAILDKADALRQKRKRAIALLDGLTQSIFSEMFGDPLTNERGWPAATIGKLLTRIDGGWSPVCLDEPASDGQWGVLKLSAVTSGEFIAAEQKALPRDRDPRPHLEVREGDVLFTRKNTRELVAASALVGPTRRKLMLSDLIFRLVPTPLVLPAFLQAALSYPTMRRSIQALVGGAAGSMPNISKEKLKAVTLVNPALELQQEFADVVSKLRDVRSAGLSSLNIAEILFASLQHRAFSGQL